MLVHPRPSDLVALVACLPPAAIVLTFDVETCADPAGGDARVAGRARVVQLGIAAFSGEPLPGCGDPVHLPPGTTAHEPAPAPLRYVHRSDASDADLLAAFAEADEPAAADPATATPAAPAVAGYVFSDVVMVNPGCRIDPASQAIHRITDAQVRQGPGLAAIADELLLWLTGADPETGVAERAVYLCGYNALRYDVPVLAADLRRVGRGDVADVLLRTRMLDAMLGDVAYEENTRAVIDLSTGLAREATTDFSVSARMTGTETPFTTRGRSSILCMPSTPDCGGFRIGVDISEP